MNTWSCGELASAHLLLHDALSRVSPHADECETIKRALDALEDADDALDRLDNLQSAVPHYCKPCGEVLTETEAVCPFCGRDATPVDEMPFVCGKGGCPLGGDL